MKREKLLIFIMSVVSLLPITNLLAQVTIGSADSPVAGALLQLKENEGATNNGNRGLGMPRVKLKSLTATDNNLATTIDGASLSPAWDTDVHTGLLVYNIDHCSLKGTGLYVWSGMEWQKLGKASLAELKFSVATLDFNSGRDLRGAVMPKTFDLSWNPNGASINAPKYNFVASDFTTISPTSGSLLTTSPQTMTVQPAAMTPATITANPFATISKTITFNSGVPCNLTKDITITQTNYALKANNSLNNTAIVYTAAGDGSFLVESNTHWTTSKSDPKNLLSSTTPSIGSTNGTELTFTSIPFSYKIANGTKYQTTAITFSDADNVKRFNDVTVNILNCSNTKEPTLSEWRDQLVAANGGTLDRDEIAPNGVAWHEDHQGNIFFSMNYDATNVRGSNNRWMISNLATTAFTTTGRTGYDSAIITNIGSTFTGEQFKIPFLAYPSDIPKAAPNQGINDPSNPTRFNERQRLGMLYNWAAATNSLGGTNGTDMPADTKAGQAYPTHRKIQGICPNGWHLPSDLEFTQLENVMLQQTASYSSIANLTPSNSAFIIEGNTSLSRPATLINGTGQGQAMIDMCETTAGVGKSNSLLNGGFSALFTGYGSMGTIQVFGTLTLYWSSSSNSQTNGETAWARVLQKDNPRVARNTGHLRGGYCSVRCKKDL